MAEHQLEVATLGGGCFWCLDAIYRDVEGVERIVAGYSGGHVPNPTYEQVCSHRTGHAEVVQIWFDPAVISYEDILYIFWRIHDPTTLDRQGNDVGSQYRSVIFYHDEAQRAAAEKTRAEAEAALALDMADSLGERVAQFGRCAAGSSDGLPGEAGGEYETLWNRQSEAAHRDQVESLETHFLDAAGP